ncbi:MAG TPA: class I tRNA ligase family protein [Streptosporangiaceae bacterium]|nr:class I tRNA ligase family protein [Streptosporangiaceae bacterium]
MTASDAVVTTASDEQAILSRWDEAGLFRAPAVESADEVEGLIPPPPSPNGRLHVGHALNLALQDVYARQRRMAGKKVLWPALIDHGGSATQYAVEKTLAARGLDHRAMSREEFVGHIRRENDENCVAILDQMRRFGALMDYAEVRFMGDETRSASIGSIFKYLYERDMLYRSEAIVNWCPGCGSALSELDISTEVVSVPHYMIKFPVSGQPGRWLEARHRNVETLLGDPAIVVHPDDERFADLVGKHVDHPLTGEPIPVVTGQHVDRQFGPGAARHTPAMCQVDYELGRTEGLPVIPVYTADGRVRWEDGRLLDVEEARAEALNQLRTRGNLGKQEPRQIQLTTCSRCGTEVQPSLSRQWFLRRQPFIPYGHAALADGELELRPSVYEERYSSWLDQLEQNSVEREDWWETCCVSFEQGISGSKDWCISRQLAWGNAIPAWVCDDCGTAQVTLEALDPDAAPPACTGCGHPMHADTDVLDMAFSCALYAVVAMESVTADKRLLEKIHHNTVAFTGSDLVYFWVPFAAMIGKFTRGHVPFRTAWLHGLVSDPEGRKMSKSLGNVVTFDEAVERVGAEGLRYALLDVFDLDRPQLGVDMDLVEQRQAGRREIVAALTQAGTRLGADAGGPPPAATATTVAKLAADVEGDIRDMRIESALRTLREVTLADEPLLVAAYRDLLALWHPFLPFTTEMLFQRHFPGQGTLAVQPWPGRAAD